MSAEEIVEVEARSANRKLIQAVEKFIEGKRKDSRGRSERRDGRYKFTFDVNANVLKALRDSFADNADLAITEIARSQAPDENDILAMVQSKVDASGGLNIDYLADISDFSSYTPEPEIKLILEKIHAQFSDITKLISGLEPTVEGKGTPVLQIGKPCDESKECIVIVGGMHADEWVPTEGVLYFAYAICAAVSFESDIEYHRFKMSHDQIDTFLQNYNLVIVPCLNPDGRAYTQNPSADSDHIEWRKNRSPGRQHFGVDINRNFDIAWHLHQFAEGHVSASDSESDRLYKGRQPESEVETRNLKYLFDRFEACRVYIDVHAFGDLILIPWAIDTNQFSNPDMNEANPAYDGYRGKKSCDYAEYMRADDHMRHIYMATAMNTAICKGADKLYELIEASHLYSTGDGQGVGICGASPDYAYSRHIKSNQAKGKILAFTLEIGNKNEAEPYAPKKPSINTAKGVITELCCALAGACSALQDGDQQNIL